MTKMRSYTANLGPRNDILKCRNQNSFTAHTILRQGMYSITWCEKVPSSCPVEKKKKNSLFIFQTSFSPCVAPQYMLRLQWGRFDSPDRTFSSIHETWNNTITLTTDVKEVRALPVDYIRLWFKFLICRAAAHSRILWTWMERLFAQLSKASSGRPNQWTGSGWCWASPVGDRSQRFCSKDATSARVWLRTTTFTPMDWSRFWVQTTWRGGSQGQQWYRPSSSFLIFFTDTHPETQQCFITSPTRVQ